LERGLVANPKNEELWLASTVWPIRCRTNARPLRLELITIETKVGNHAVALTKLTTALQECPKSGLLWAESIFLENRQQRKSRSVYALKQCDRCELRPRLCYLNTVIEEPSAACTWYSLLRGFSGASVASPKPETGLTEPSECNLIWAMPGPFIMLLNFSTERP
jgi:hypothetical protein